MKTCPNISSQSDNDRARRKVGQFLFDYTFIVFLPDLLARSLDLRNFIFAQAHFCGARDSNAEFPAPRLEGGLALTGRLAAWLGDPCERILQ